MNMLLSISFLKSNYSISDTISKINDLDYMGFVHVDICDGDYVKASKTDFALYLNVLKDIYKPLDIHLMVNHPLDYIKDLLDLKPAVITVHIDSLDNIDEIASILKDNNIKMGLAINPFQDITLLNNYLDIADLVLIMSVNPGMGGQKFLEFIPSKIDYLNEIKNDNNYDFLVEVDGGINDKTISLIRGKVDIFVCGSFICCSDDYNKQVEILRDIL